MIIHRHHTICFSTGVWLFAMWQRWWTLLPICLARSWRFFLIVFDFFFFYCTMTPKPKVVDIPVLMLLRSKEIIRNWDDWPFSLFPYKEADVGIIAGFAKTAGFFSGQWSCCSCGDIMQISESSGESSGECVLSARVSVDRAPRGLAGRPL